MVDCKPRWGQWRVFYLTEDGQLAYFPASWTDAGPKDPFVEQAQGRALTRMEDLLRLGEMVAERVNEIPPAYVNVFLPQKHRPRQKSTMKTTRYGC